MPTVRYVCDFCGMPYEKRSETLKHEKKCDFNPKRQRCETCHYYENDFLLSDCGHVEIEESYKEKILTNSRKCNYWKERINNEKAN